MADPSCANTEYLTAADAAKLLALTPAGIRLAALSGRLRVAARTVGGVRLFTREDVETFARRRGAAA